MASGLAAMAARLEARQLLVAQAPGQGQMLA